MSVCPNKEINGHALHCTNNAAEKNEKHVQFQEW